MTVTFGFYDSLSGDRVYNAAQMGAIFEGVFTDGIFKNIGTSLIVTQDTGANMNVKVGAGRCWFKNTWTNNDAPVTMTVPASTVGLNRIDTIYVEIDKNPAVRTNSIKLTSGTPASTPVAITMNHTSTLDQYRLADIYVGSSVTTISNANITSFVGTEQTPYILGILDQAASLQTQIDAINTELDTLPTVPTMLIDGMGLSWVSNTSIKVEAGECYAKNGDRITFTIALTKTGISLGANTWGHVYAYQVGGAVNYEVVTTAPTLWKGTAYIKGADQSRRYLGSIKTDASGNIYNFSHNPTTGAVHYLSVLDVAPFRALANGAATTPTVISLSDTVPVTARFSLLKFSNSNTSYLLAWGMDATYPSLFVQGKGVTGVTNTILYPFFPLSASQSITYSAGGAGGGAYCDMAGYFFSR